MTLFIIKTIELNDIYSISIESQNANNFNQLIPVFTPTINLK
jgi:hypothetical protein